MPRFIAVVDTDKDRVRFSSRNGEDLGANAFDIGEVARRRNFLTRRGRVVGVYCIDQIVFVTGFVLHEKNVLAVAAPEVRGDRPGSIRSDRLCLIKRIFRALNPDVARAFERPHEGDELAVRRNLRPRDFRVAEEEFAVDYWRPAIRLCRNGNAIYGEQCDKDKPSREAAEHSGTALNETSHGKNLFHYLRSLELDFQK